MRNVTIMAAVAALLVPYALPVMGQEETDYQRDRKSQEDFRLPLEIKTGEKACYQVICRKTGMTAIPGSDRPTSEPGEKDHAEHTGITRVTRPADDAGDTWTFTLEPTRGNSNGNAMVTVTVAAGSRDANARDRDDGNEDADHTIAAKSERTYLVEVDRGGRIVRCNRQGISAVAGDPAKPEERPVAVGTKEVPVSADQQDGEVKMALACIFGSGLHERTLTTGQVYELDTGAGLARATPYGSDGDRPGRSGDRPSGDRPDRTAPRPFNTTDATTPRIGLKFTGVTGEPKDENADEYASRKGRLANFSVVPFSSAPSSPRIGGSEDPTNPDRAATAVTAAGAQVSGTASYHADTGCLESLNVSMGSSITDPTTPDASGPSANAGGKWISIRYQASEEKDDDKDNKDNDKDDK
jgi:hypothetical protein